jgi:multiple sugar transport system permease protein
MKNEAPARRTVIDLEYIRSLAGSVSAWILLLLAVVWSFFPILFIFSSSLTDPARIFSYPPTIFSRPTLANYGALLSDWPDFFRSMLNSVIIMTGTIVLTAVVCLPGAYALSRFRNKYTRVSGMTVIIARMFPPIIITIPLFPILQMSGLVDKHIVLIFLYSSFYLSLGLWILKNFIDTIPYELEEAAYLEGSSRFRTFLTIVLPLSWSGVVSISILVAIFCWNEFLFAFLFTSFNAVTTPVLLNEMLGAMFGVSWGPLFAATSLQLLPILIFIWLVQKFLVKGTGFASEK